MTISTNRDSDRFIVRLPDGMRDRIKDAAAANNRSMNAEIVATLEKEYPAPFESIEAQEVMNEIVRLAQIVTFEGASGDEVKAAVKRINELDATYKKLVGGFA